MTRVLEVRGLCKRYPAFELKDVSFSLAQGHITGFIGRNGAGKTTTLNALMRLVHADAGEIRFFGCELNEKENEIKQRIGFVSSGMGFYPLKKLKTITAVTRSFYTQWDDDAYQRYMHSFRLDERKTPSQLSNGMKVKYALALALSHNADLLMLDEPTSGLDPVSREDLLETLLDLCDEGKTILFSTHITSDLDKCADDILYLKAGRLVAQDCTRGFLNRWRLAAYEDGQLNSAQQALLIGRRRSKDGWTALVDAAHAAVIAPVIRDATLEDIMVHLEKEEADA